MFKTYNRHEIKVLDGLSEFEHTKNMFYHDYLIMSVFCQGLLMANYYRFVLLF